MASRSPSRRLRLAFLASIVAVAGSACVADDEPDGLTLSFFGTGGEGRKPRTLEGGLVLEEVWVGLSSFTLATGPDCQAGGANDAKLEGPVAVDLLAGASLPGELFIRTRPMAYCGFELDLVPVGDEARGFVPDEMENRSIWVRGRRADGTELQIVDDFSLHIAAGTGEPFIARPPLVGLIGQFHVDRWLDAATLGAELEGPGGGIRIDATHDLYAPFRAAVAEEIGLFLLLVGG